MYSSIMWLILNSATCVLWSLFSHCDGHIPLTFVLRASFKLGDVRKATISWYVSQTGFVAVWVFTNCLLGGTLHLITTATASF